MAREVLSEINDQVCVISLNRPDKLNCLNEALIVALKQALAQANADDSVGAIVLHGNGRAFSSGDDLEDSLDRIGDDVDRSYVESYSRTLQDVTREIYFGDKFVVGAIHGFAVGAGFEWAVNCDFSIWAEGTTAFFPEMRWGMFPTGGVTALLPSIVGLTTARELLLFGDKFSAEQLHALGLAWKVVPEEDLLAEAISVAKKIAALPARAVHDLKQTINQCCFGDVERALERETQGITDAVMDPTTRELIKQFEHRRR